MNMCVAVNIISINSSLRSVNHCGASGLYDPDTKLTRFGARDYDYTAKWPQSRSHFANL